jgi:Chitin binding Peritrophin-A domain
MNIYSAIIVAVLLVPIDAQTRCSSERDGTLLPVPESRAGFIRCVGNSDVRETCKNGQEFNPFSRTCVTPPRASHMEPQNLCFNQPDNVMQQKNSPLSRRCE